MLDTNKFVDLLVENSYTHVCCVPCSFAKYLINACINSKKIEYIACASEAVAASVACGLSICGKKPLVIAQSSGLSNMISNLTSMALPYGIKFAILISQRTYKDGDSEVQHKHLATHLKDLITAIGYKNEILSQNDESIAISQLDSTFNEHKICILQKDTFDKIELLDEFKLDLSDYPKRSEYLKILDLNFINSDYFFIGTTGNTSREMYNIMKNTNNFYMAGNMGGALSLALGVAKSGKKVVVCGGDAEFAMHAGGIITAGRYANEVDITYIVFDNEANKSTGAQASYQKHLDYENLVKSCGFKLFNFKKEIFIKDILDFNFIADLENFSLALKALKNDNTMKFLRVKCNFDEEMPRPPLKIVARNKI